MLTIPVVKVSYTSRADWSKYDVNVLDLKHIQHPEYAFLWNWIARAWSEGEASSPFNTSIASFITISSVALAKNILNKGISKTRICPHGAPDTSACMVSCSGRQLLAHMFSYIFFLFFVLFFFSIFFIHHIQLQMSMLYSV